MNPLFGIAVAAGLAGVAGAMPLEYTFRGTAETFSPDSDRTFTDFTTTITFDPALGTLNVLGAGPTAVTSFFTTDFSIDFAFDGADVDVTQEIAPIDFPTLSITYLPSATGSGVDFLFAVQRVKSATDESPFNQIAEFGFSGQGGDAANFAPGEFPTSASFETSQFSNINLTNGLWFRNETEDQNGIPVVIDSELSAWTYSLDSVAVRVIPTPGTGVLVGVAGFAAVRRRR